MLARVASVALRRAEGKIMPQMVRALSVSAASAAQAELKLPTAPLQLSGTSAQIATLLWQVAAKENQLDKVQDELYQFIELFKQHSELRRLATDPFVPTLVRTKIISSVLKDSGASEITKKLFEALADEGALSALLEVTVNYEELMLAHKKEVYCTVITAEPLDKLERVELTKKAEKFVDAGFKLVMQEKIDKKLLGGFVIEFSDRRVDMSTAKKVEEFNNFVNKLVLSI
uniref:Mitochondrial ATP synthase subunit OSCP n=1 Tax=Polytomella sp. Pringsheim 198.80 TaxID=37502 RepID=D8V7I1_9CHLO|nr:Chain P, Mitochondrial ATP synthase subunit OSCP [Polytomella sp. Pringsheim 198.80]6RD6_P Chain P, Mitochondrial ATP synthase subunit OSCP [Polytomella sp. Pringsheim 198.80]6RD9_P Chain P, Mitochondrial ATP synthase subunit OSCP [Polytomella sp. Pringsheim 198.80]6RDA_P Chain P, Mitochondrial ATP synthase subunit OSCP [Polytomella sp. Pringsheim 198.80]6RDB_P Chain P, Mitochondrial ATP synthase subunit OSCP [Polytomella sp. Pringsheim 198.80]6RDC_P Chain P, Mitochondrial ATP synthase subu|mmetsp:Transcript_20931/g.37422  ORF Transcript_20931/g.37422 Transcript_20931/m.37422 type:complete len:230 (-) Transcript_20931:211-900(-)|eukprot:CAMPEP_0175041728 /NCGR_PEP_ID=MMETSP0052_2-20121109/2104_1 /TAXON_ID=51329 ORGANISM="Polytomella parva, Strain SAG 63-3" /NCGR_SAMPLE_ID=MMETSP0052_2 /ASSEMBLY_ACC=CAM_ASM_000194 /LENGTH=229 /DNA_ID=CAMNT_0016304331 /DNA_START=96 /DNA_END=785 /DNA_ORIENTATION=+